MTSWRTVGLVGGAVDAVAGPMGAIVGAVGEIGAAAGGIAGGLVGGVAAFVVTSPNSSEQRDPQTASHEQQMELLRRGLTSQGRFQLLAQRLVPTSGPPTELIDEITEAVKTFLGDDAQLEKQGSVKKHTNSVGSDFDYHITMPSGWVMSASEVTYQQMCQIQGLLQSKGINALMGPIALKVRYTEGRLEGSIDIVPCTGSYFDPSCLYYSEFHNDIRRRNAVRVLRYWVCIVQGHKVRSHSIEQLVLSVDACSGCGDDAHGLHLFTRACSEGGYGTPC